MMWFHAPRRLISLPVTVARIRIDMEDMKMKRW